jgi:hypothetical protein
VNDPASPTEPATESENTRPSSESALDTTPLNASAPTENLATSETSSPSEATGSSEPSPPPLDGTVPAASESVTGPRVQTRPAKNGFLRRLWRNPARDWALLFLLIQAVVNVDGFVNSYSRWCTMVALAENRTVCIDGYEQHTIDWSQTPDGHYYSNKAPGPALLGYPVFWVMDRFDTWGIRSRPERDQRRLDHRLPMLHALSVLTQALPYALLVLLVVAGMQERGFSKASLHWVAVGLLFGNTACLFMNTYFGHGMSTMFILALLLALHRRRPFLAGLAFGLAVLCDYSVPLLILPVLLAMWRLRPAAGFASYHYHCFGSPLSLANKFQNPAFVDMAKGVPNLWGVLRLLPRPEVIGDLLWSQERGLLFTQPWVLLALLLLPVLLWCRAGWTAEQRAFAKWTAGYATFGLLLLLWMNGSFGGWHGGATPGPRYLSPAFPALIITTGAIYGRAPLFWRQLLTVGLIASLLPFVLLFSTTEILAQPESQILPFYLNQLFSGQGKNLQRFVFIVLGFGWAAWRARDQFRSDAYARCRSPKKTK